MKGWAAGLFIVLIFMYNQCGGLAQGETSAKAACVLELETGRVLFESNMHTRLPMASTTKAMTALLAIEQGDLSDTVTCSENAFGVSGTSIYLQQGETLTLEEMLLGLMLSSGNDAAVAIAEHIGGSLDGFVQMMNARAVQIGAVNTHFANPHGLPDDAHYTTAYDLALIAREAMGNPVFRRIVSTQRATIPWEGRTYNRQLNNKNRLLTSYEGATGVKTGFTSKAGRCLVFGAQRGGMEIIGVVLGCSDWFDEAERLMDGCYQTYTMAHVLGAHGIRRAACRGGWPCGHGAALPDAGADGAAQGGGSRADRAGCARKRARAGLSGDARGHGAPGRGRAGVCAMRSGGQPARGWPVAVCGCAADCVPVGAVAARRGADAAYADEEGLRR